jgi:hypothetical protein
MSTGQKIATTLAIALLSLGPASAANLGGSAPGAGGGGALGLIRE